MMRNFLFIALSLVFVVSVSVQAKEVDFDNDPRFQPYRSGPDLSVRPNLCVGATTNATYCISANWTNFADGIYCSVMMCFTTWTSARL
jgi:hypothetical protein